MTESAKGGERESREWSYTFTFYGIVEADDREEAIERAMDSVADNDSTECDVFVEREPDEVLP